MQIAEEMGDICKLTVGFWDIYFLNHPDYIQHVFLDNWKNYSRDTFQFNQFSRVTGKGLLNTHGEYWRQQRRLAQPGFHKNKLDGMAQKMAAAVERMHGRWDHLLQDQDSIELDIDAEMLRLGLEIVGSALFSLDLSQDSADLSQEILAMMAYVVYRSQNLLALPTWVPTARNLRFRRSLRKVDQIIYTMIEDRQRLGEKKDDLLDLFLGGRDAENRPLPNRAIRDEVITMIIAGYETVATGMSWMWDVLSRHPHEVAKIQAEIKEWDGSVSADLVSRFPYASAAIDEVFRLYPPSWLVTRRAVEDDAIGGYQIPAGSILVVCPYSIHHHSSFWNNQFVYQPERHLIDYANFEKYAYIPFGGGPHLCIGRPFAKLEAATVLLKTLKTYRLTALGHEAPLLRPQVTLRPENQVRLKVTPI